jgi:Nucleotide modification associated domain 2
MPRLFSYTIAVDDGAAPNPFHGICTLAICKPTIRRVAEKGDWVAATGSIKNGLAGKLVCAMLVDEVISLEAYDRRAIEEWPHRIPDFQSTNLRDRLGDCIYDYSSKTPPAQRRGVHDKGNCETDWSGVNVLIAREYYYFGASAVDLPSGLLPIIHQTQGHKSNANAPYFVAFENWVRGLTCGVQGEPDWMIDWELAQPCAGCKARAEERVTDPVC